MDTDDALLEGLRRGDTRAYTALFEAYVDRIFRLAVNMLKNEADAEEVVQATFLSAFEGIDHFEQRGKLSTWLYTIAYRHALMLLRKRQTSREATEQLPEEDEQDVAITHFVDWSGWPEAQALNHEAQEMIREAVAQLPDGLRSAFVLRDIEGLSTADCAQIQVISEGACKVRLHRARLALRERLSAYFSNQAEVEA